MNFGDTSPFYLKISMSAIHTFGSVMVSAMAWQMAQDESGRGGRRSMQTTTCASSTEEMQPPTTIIPRTTKQALAMADLGGVVGSSSEEFWRVLMGGNRIDPRTIDSGEPPPPVEFPSSCITTTDPIPNDTPPPSTPPEWVLSIMKASSASDFLKDGGFGETGDRVHSEVGTVGFASIPILIAMIACMMSLIPGIARQGTASAPMHALVSVIGFCVCCIHSGASMPLRIVDDGMMARGNPRMEMAVVIFALHASCHVLYQSGRGISNMQKTMRKCTAIHLQMATPIMWSFLFLIHVLSATCMQTRRWASAHTHQDVMLTHAVLAFVPEVLGTMYMWARRCVQQY